MISSAGYWDPKTPASIPSTRYDLDDDLDEELPVQYRLPSPQKKPKMSPTRKQNRYPSDNYGLRGQRSLNVGFSVLLSLLNDVFRRMRWQIFTHL